MSRNENVGRLEQGLFASQKHFHFESLDVAMENGNLLQLAGGNEVIHSNRPGAVCGHTRAAADQSLQESAFKTIGGEIPFPEQEVLSDWLDHVSPRLGNLLAEPHGIKRPVGAQFEHGASRKNLFQDF